jgi:uncharacterized membrane protein
MSPLPLGTKIVAGAFLTSGIVHLVRPQVFEPLVPRVLPARRGIILGSGAVEIACAVGLVTLQPWAPWASSALLVAVWPGNVTMAVTWQRSQKVSAPMKVVAWARLPLQVPLIRWAWRSPVREG